MTAAAGWKLIFTASSTSAPSGSACNSRRPSSCSIRETLERVRETAGANNRRNRMLLPAEVTGAPAPLCQRTRARVGRRSVKLKEGSLLLVEQNEEHQVENTGRKKPLVTLNFYVPPAYARD